MKRVATIVGARPQFIKAAAMSWAFRRKTGVVEELIHTGQHYDPGLSDVFFRELEIPAPRHHLEIGSGSHGAQTGEMLKQVERLLEADRPDLVLVYGDTNSTLAGALAAAKLHIPVAHVEAGLRSFNRAMPEEINRIVTDHLSTWHFCPTRKAVEHLRTEGLTTGVHLVGDVMFDVALKTAERSRTQSRFVAGALQPKSFTLATVHRAENTDDPTRLAAILGALSTLSKRLKIIFPIHPRTRRVMAERGLTAKSIEFIDPVGMLDMTWLEANAALIVTDSGGVQKEAYFHQTPCVTVRTETEWVETIQAGWNSLADPGDSGAIVAAATKALEGGLPRQQIADYGDGHAADAIVSVLERALA